ncbi:GDSL-type esterase/lipase family protein [Streptomyces sp. RB6PN25]|uniref:GDSL-type esterase/lipase family protein n=1 Tax=Streptomyces humicola TaxID=2953240 RepID=A0ABT1Q4V6_9ACTN|nr:SGNH/GDSL hydrolase family protein [Streptomyces humicola]MCQ4083810.1 GDSL-type esterase/lipase family protein [Streptomyces humicola]
MTRKSGYALLTALVAVAALACTAILMGTGALGSGLRRPGSVPQIHATADPAAAGSWTGTWAAAPATAEPGTPQGRPGMSIRDVVHTSIGGNAARIELSNLFGTAPLILTHVTLARAAAPGSPSASPGSLTALGFAGLPVVTIPAGGSVLSDPVRLAVPAATDLLITLYTPYTSGPVTYHPTARQTSYLAYGDHAGDTDGTAFTIPSPYWRYVTAVDVWTPGLHGTVVAFGDSITDGITSTVGADHRWPDFLTARLGERPDLPRMGVLDEGISGNRVLADAAPTAPWDGPSALRRFGRDVLSRAGVKVVIVELGINDIIETPHQTDAQAIIDGLRQLTREAHAHGIRVLGGTITPFEGLHGYTPALDAVREDVNAAIRAGTVFDAVVDFDRALRDPHHPDHLLPAFDSGDHLHPTDAGYEAMAQAVNLQDLLGSAPASL